MAFQDILVPTDFGSGSRAAVEQALDSLGPEGGRVAVLHVLDQRFLNAAQALFPETNKEEWVARLRQEAHEHYTQLMAGIEAGKAECELLVVEGVPFLKIVQFARDLDVDVIVMALHRGPEHFEQLLFGSTVERVLRITPRPVLIVPETPKVGVAN